MGKKFCLLPHYELEDFSAPLPLFQMMRNLRLRIVEWRTIKYVNGNPKPEHKDAIV